MQRCEGVPDGDGVFIWQGGKLVCTPGETLTAVLFCGCSRGCACLTVCRVGEGGGFGTGRLSGKEAHWFGLRLRRGLTAVLRGVKLGMCLLA